MITANTTKNQARVWAVTIPVLLAFCLQLNEGIAQVTFLPRVGVTISTVTWKPTQSLDVIPQVSFVVGAGAEFPIAEQWRVLGEVSYLSRNFRTYLDAPASGGSRLRYDYELRQPFIDIPLMVKRYFDVSTVKLYASVGGYAGIGLEGTRTGNSDFYPAGGPADVIERYGLILYEAQPSGSSLPDVYYENRVDYGIIASGGIVFAKVIVLDLRYGAGLVDLDEGQGGYKNRTIQISMSVPLQFSRKE